MGAVQPSAALLTGQLVDGRYRVGDLIGRGAMSEVYRVEDDRLSRTMALKVLRPGSTDRERFAEETTLLCALDHPHLVRLHDAGEHAGIPYLVLNLMDRSLAEVLAGGPLVHGAVARVGQEIASALDYLHARQIVHRDVKPSNVLLSEDGSACLADLGAARAIGGARLTATGMTIGTPMYLAPEQAAGEPVGPPADVYSLGLVLIEAATGEPVFGGAPQEALAARLLRSPDVPTSLPSGLRSVLQRMVAVDQDLRPTPAELAAELSNVRLDQAVPASAQPPPTTVISPPTVVAPSVPAARADATQRMLARPSAVVLAAHGAGDRVVGWVRADRDRAIRLGLVALLLVGLVLGLASRAGSFPDTRAVESVPTTTPTVPPTTAPPTTVAPAPAVGQPTEREGGGNGREGKDGNDRNDDKNDDD